MLGYVLVMAEECEIHQIENEQQSSAVSFIFAGHLSTLSAKFYDTVVNLFTKLGVARLPKGLVWLMLKLCNLQSLLVENRRRDSSTPLRSARLNARLRERNDITHFLLNGALSTILSKPFSVIDKMYSKIYSVGAGRRWHLSLSIF